MTVLVLSDSLSCVCVCVRACVRACMCVCVWCATCQQKSPTRLIFLWLFVRLVFYMTSCQGAKYCFLFPIEIRYHSADSWLLPLPLPSPTSLILLNNDHFPCGPTHSPELTCTCSCHCCPWQHGQCGSL